MEMIPVEYIIAMSMSLVNIFKKYLPSATVPFVTIIVAILFNVLNAFLFGGEFLLAGRDAFISTGIFVGMFAGADAIRKSEKTPIKCTRENCDHKDE